MARREQFRLPGGLPIETGVDNSQRWFVGYRKGSSMGGLVLGIVVIFGIVSIVWGSANMWKR